MKVPEYSPQAKLNGLPNVRQSINTSASDFLDPTAAMIAPLGQAAQQVSHDMMQHYQQERRKADQLRANEAAIALQNFDQDAAYSKTGWRNVLGKDVFSQQNSKPLTDNVLEARNQFISDTLQGLGNEDQKALFKQYADESSVRLRGQLLGHEGEQYRRYQKSTLEAGIATEAKAAELEFNDIPMMEQRYAKIRQYHEELANMEGMESAYGKAKADGFISQSIKNAVSASLQHGDHDTAKAILNRFKEAGSVDANDATAMQHHINDSYGAAMVANAPAELKRLIEESGGIESAILGAEGGQDNFDANGQPAVSSDGKSIGKYQVTDDTARAPGFGIAPAKARTHEEYNRIGKELIAKLSDKYGGDPEKVAAAYNAGSGAVDKAIAKGGENWKDHIPASTRDQYLPRFNKHLKTGTAVDDFSQEQRLRWGRAAESQIHVSMAHAQTQLEERKKAQYSQAEFDGKVGDLISKAEFQSAYGDKADEAYDRYIRDLDYGQTLHSVKKMTTAEAAANLQAAMPPDGDPDHPHKREQYEKLQSAITKEFKQRNEDPMLWAQSLGLDVQQINFDNQANAAAEIAKRKTIAEKLYTDYGTGYALMTKQEADALSDVIRTTSDDNVLKVLKGFRDGLQDDNAYHATISQLRKDSPATLIAGHLIGQHASSVKKGWLWMDDTRTEINGEDVARTILRGERILNPSREDKKGDGNRKVDVLPKEARAAYAEAVGDAYYSPQVNDAMYEAVTSYYAAVASNAAGVFDQDKFDEAIRNVTGGIIDHAGHKVALPYGMDESYFLDQVRTQYAAQTGDVSRKHVDDMPLVSMGVDTYAFKTDQGFFKNKDGKLVTVSFR